MSKEYIERETLEEKLDRRLQELRKKYGPFDRYTDGFDEAVDIVDGVQPAADVVEVVRCDKCEFWESTDTCKGLCNGRENGLTREYTKYNDHCSYGERKDGVKS